MSESRWRVMACTLLLVAPTACGDRINTENFQRIEKGMTRDKVVDVLGEPDELNSMGVGELQGTSAQWRGDERMITVLFANGKVVFKSLGEAPAEPQGEGSP